MDSKTGLRFSIGSALAVVGILMFAPDVDAHITEIQIITKESPTFGGYSWPDVGQYEKIVGKAFGEIDPTDPKNSIIVDILLPPRNARGRSSTHLTGAIKMDPTSR